jgi:endonuclease YncB( thermonuclease family)
MQAPQYRRIPVFGLTRRACVEKGWRGGIFAGILATAVTPACGCFGPAAAQTAQAAPLCGSDELARGTVTRVIDGRTFVLDDGREVRLAAIEVPPLPPSRDSSQGSGQKSGRESDQESDQDSGAQPDGSAARGARDALVALAEGDRVLLRRAEAAADRYGRLLAYAYTERDGDELFVQGELIASGFARVGDRIASRACAAELFKRENTARTAKLGLWTDPYYEVLDAETPADVLAHRGRFALVEGRVVSMRESGATIYVNFGRHWSEDFTVTVLKRNERNFAAAGLDLKSLEGRRIRVRGWVEQRGGTGGDNSVPWIEAERPEQIEIASQ